MVKCSKNELHATAINTEKDDDKINTLSKTRNNVYLLIMNLPSYYEIIANQNKKLIKSRSLADTLSNKTVHTTVSKVTTL